jgi:glycosyltransferase involved in cell wall biosynthesis
MLIKPNQYNAIIRWMDRRIMSERNDPSRKPAKEYSDAKKCYSKADFVVFQSKHVQNLFSKEIQAKSTIIRNPVGVPCFADPFPANRIVTVGRYATQKNHKLLIQSFYIFHQTHTTYTLHLYGDGPLRNELQMLIEDLHLQNDVFLEGFKENIHEEISNAKMIVLSSDFEGMSNALMEAMMMGIPCISTSCTGSNELLNNEETGLLVPVGDKEALASAMCRMADDDELRNRLRDHAQLQSIEFEKEKIVLAWERILFR